MSDSAPLPLAGPVARLYGEPLGIPGAASPRTPAGRSASRRCTSAAGTCPSIT